MLRWKVEAKYKTHRVSKIFFIEELYELQDIIERGSDRNDLDYIAITLNRTLPPTEP